MELMPNYVGLPRRWSALMVVCMGALGASLRFARQLEISLRHVAAVAIFVKQSPALVMQHWRGRS